MERDPGDFQRGQQGGGEQSAAADLSVDDAISARLEMLAPCPGLSATLQQTADADAIALQDVAAGRVVPHEQVAAWLATSGTPEFKPMPREWLA